MPHGAQRPEHPVGHCPQPLALLLKTLGQPALLVHLPTPAVSAR